MENSDSISSESSNSAKLSLEPLLIKYTNRLLEELEQEKIIFPVGNSSSMYSLSMKEPVLKEERFDANPDLISIRINEFNEFRNLVRRVAFDLNVDNKDGLTSSFMSHFHDLGIINFQISSVRGLKEIVDGQYLLNDDEIKSDAVKLLDKANLNINKERSNLLEFHARENIGSQFKNHTFSKGDSSSIGIDVVGAAKLDDLPDLLFEVKYRNKIESVIKDVLFQSHEALIKHESNTTRNAHFIIIAYIEDDPSTFERIQYKFIQFIEELFPDYKSKFSLVLIQASKLDNLKKELAKIYSDIFGNQKFRFFNQIPPLDHPEIDDHYWEKTMPLHKGCKYILKVKPRGNYSHWRLGLKFSRSNAFPHIVPRHGTHGCPIYHISKSTDHRGIAITYYDSTNKAMQIKSALGSYNEEAVYIRIRNDGEMTIVDLVDVSENPRSSINHIHEVNFFKVFAWADSKNEFEIDAEIQKLE